MDPTLKLWIVILTVGLLNYLSRLSFIAVFAHRTMPPLLARALKYVPAAMLTALIVPMILSVPATGSAFDPRVVAAIIAGIVAFYTQSTLKSLGTGLGALWLLQALAARIG